MMNVSMIRSAPGVIALAVVVAASSAGAQTDADSFGSAVRFVQRDGEVIYRTVCQGCHMPQGEGAIGAGDYPALASNKKLEIRDYPIAVVVKGLNAMPPFTRMLDDEQVAAVVNYVRTHFGNSCSDSVSPAHVKAVRQRK